MQISLRFKLNFILIALLAFLTLIASVISTYELQKYYKDLLRDEMANHISEVTFLLTETDLITACEAASYDMLSRYAQIAQIRLTFIDSSGSVLFDSMVPRDSLSRLENHLHRPEIQMALHKEVGQDQRVSASLGQSMYYLAKTIESTSFRRSSISETRFIRLSVPMSDVTAQLRMLRLKIYGGGIVALLLFSLLSLWLSAWLSSPIKKMAQIAESVKKGRLQAHFEHKSRDDIGKLADLLNEMLAKLREDLIQMRKLETVRSQFLANVSHELRTPIFAVQGYLETIMNSALDDPKIQKHFIGKAYHQTVRLNSLLTDLIDIARIESGEMKLSFQEFNLIDLLARQVEELRSKAKEYNVQLKFKHREKSGPVIVLGDQERLVQVIVNLLVNAIKYNVPGGKVEVGYRDLDREVEVYVADTGRGIPLEHQSRIFERFYRVDKQRSRAVGGTGLGLAIVKHIVEAHDSKIRVDSEPGKGSVFIFKLRKAGIE